MITEFLNKKECCWMRGVGRKWRRMISELYSPPKVLNQYTAYWWRFHTIRSIVVGDISLRALQNFFRTHDEVYEVVIYGGRIMQIARALWWFRGEVITIKGELGKLRGHIWKILSRARVLNLFEIKMLEEFETNLGHLSNKYVYLPRNITGARGAKGVLSMKQRKVITNATAKFEKVGSE